MTQTQQYPAGSVFNMYSGIRWHSHTVCRADLTSPLYSMDVHPYSVAIRQSLLSILLFHRELCNVAQVILADHHGVGDIHSAVAVYIGGFFLRICRGNIAQIDLADQHGIGDINDAICIYISIFDCTLICNGQGRVVMGFSQWTPYSISRVSLFSRFWYIA